MRARRTFGFRSDRPYVRLLVRRGRFEYDGWIPVTRRERRYLRLRERLTLGARAYRWLDRRPHVSGGESIEDGWPGEPYMLVRLTRDRAKHTRALRGRARFLDNDRRAGAERAPEGRLPRGHRDGHAQPAARRAPCRRPHSTSVRSE